MAASASRRDEMFAAVHHLREHCLFESAKWLAECLASLPEEEQQASLSSEGLALLTQQEPERPQVVLAKSYVDVKEYRRAAATLAAVPGAKARFLRCWAKYQAGEKRKVEEAVERGGPLSKSSDNDNPELSAIEAELSGEADGSATVTPNNNNSTNNNGNTASHMAAGQSGRMQTSEGVLTTMTTSRVQQGLGIDVGGRSNAAKEGACVSASGDSVSVALCQYLYGLVLLQLGRKGEARRVIVESVNTFPWNWEAWASLQKACENRNQALSLQLRSHWMSKFFFASVCLEFQHNLESLQRYDELLQTFPQSSYIVGQAATAHYNRRAFDEAQELFEKLLKEDPYRIEGQDTYSNILYVKESFAKLSYLAHKAALTDKYRPETCCVIGNYYSLKGHHEKAVLYFKRALKLNREYLSAWTLMGHEYVEMKNTSAAIEAYRRAVDISPRDYRAWYGLGQTYEILAMPYYALYYYRRATQLRPMDARMWAAMGQCYEHDQLQNLESAVRCYHRAESNGDREGIALHKLGYLYDKMGEKNRAAMYYKMNLDRMDDESGGVPDQPVDNQQAVEALDFLSGYFRDIGRLDESQTYAMRLLDYGGDTKERAKSLLRELSSLRSHNLAERF